MMTDDLRTIHCRCGTDFLAKDVNAAVTVVCPGCGEVTMIRPGHLKILTYKVQGIEEAVSERAGSASDRSEQAANDREEEERLKQDAPEIDDEWTDPPESPVEPPPSPLPGELRAIACRCGNTYRVPFIHAVVREICPDCGEVTIVRPKNLAIESYKLQGWEEGQARERSLATPPSKLVPPSDAQVKAAPGDFGYEDEPGASPPILQPDRMARGFRRDVFWSFLFISHPVNIKPFMLVWFALGLEVFLTRYVSGGGPGALAYAIFVKGVLTFLIEMWFVAFLLRVVDVSIYRAEELPALSTFSDLVEDWPRELLFPALGYLLTWVIALLPAMLFCMFWMMFAPSGAMMGAEEYVFLGFLAGLGMFLWPMLVIIAAAGDFWDFFRVDLMLQTIGRAFWPYLATVLGAYGSGAVVVGAAFLLNPTKLPRLSNPVVAAILLGGVRAYGQIVAMRVIGFYYVHYKERFAWNWDD